MVGFYFFLSVELGFQTLLSGGWRASITLNESKHFWDHFVSLCIFFCTVEIDAFYPLHVDNRWKKNSVSVIIITILRQKKKCKADKNPSTKWNVMLKLPWITAKEATAPTLGKHVKLIFFFLMEHTTLFYS